MLCPICKKTLSSTILSNVEVNYCPNCLGLWFEEEELRWAKDEKDVNIRWLDIDLWKENKKFQVSLSGKICPLCKVNLHEVKYGESNIKVDICNLSNCFCHSAASLFDIIIIFVL